MASATETVSFDIHTIADQLDHIQTNPDARIIGSLGRMVVFGERLHDPFIEFRERETADKSELNIVGPSDIDVLGIFADPELAIEAEAKGPLSIDTFSFQGSDVTVMKNETGWRLQSHLGRFFDRLLDDEIMAPQPYVLDGVPIVTVAAETHLLLHELRANRNMDEATSKDNIATMLLKRACEKSLGFRQFTNAQRGHFYELGELIGTFSRLHPNDPKLKSHSED